MKLVQSLLEVHDNCLLHHGLSRQKLVAYLKYMTTVGVLLGGKENETRHQMREVLELEMKLAQVCLPLDQ